MCHEEKLNQGKTDDSKNEKNKKFEIVVDILNELHSHEKNGSNYYLDQDCDG